MPLMYDGFVGAYFMFVVAILVITAGEMLVMPTSQALAARFAPPDMRGRYMAFLGLTWALLAMVGPAATGLILDNYNPDWVWYLCGIIAAVAAARLYDLHDATQVRFQASTVLNQQG
jgi:MFS family permease